MALCCYKCRRKNLNIYPNIYSSQRGCLCDNCTHSFLPLLIFDWRTFSRGVTAWWGRQ